MNSPANTIRVSIVEDDAGLRSSLRAMLQRMGGIECCGAYATAEEALADLASANANVVLMDIHLPGLDGVECVRRMKTQLPTTQIVMLTVHDHSHAVFNSLAAGANGFLLKPVRGADLARAIQEVYAGGAPMTPNIARLVVQRFQHPAAPQEPTADLSPREREVLELLAQGYLQKEIAEQLGISFHTVQTHTARIYEKLHVRSRAQAVARLLTTPRPTPQGAV